MREHFITYGPRTAAAAAQSTRPPPNETQKKPQRTSVEILFESIASYQVPHAYFNHFYVVSVASTLFWAFQYLSNGKLLQRIINAAAVSPSSTRPSMSMEQIELTWALMGLQGLRRQLETSMLTKPSASTMWFGHYLLGIAFYLAMSVAVWIEGAGTSRSIHPSVHHQTTPYNQRIVQTTKIDRVTGVLTTKTTSSSSETLLSNETITLSPPSSTSSYLRILLPILLFILASTIQSMTHIHLASLRKYTRPTSPLFTHLITPHYTAECIIYLSLALLAAPHPHPHPGIETHIETGTGAGPYLNTTLFTAFLFVAGNLSVTAGNTKQWYIRKFGEESVRGKWIMVPFVW